MIQNIATIGGREQSSQANIEPNIVVLLFLTVLLAIVGFIWYPIKRLLKGRKKSASVNSKTQTK